MHRQPIMSHHQGSYREPHHPHQRVIGPFGPLEAGLLGFGLGFLGGELIDRPPGVYPYPPYPIYPPPYPPYPPIGYGPPYGPYY